MGLSPGSKFLKDVVSSAFKYKETQRMENLSWLLGNKYKFKNFGNINTFCGRKKYG
jgi:hypothetical protein